MGGVTEGVRLRCLGMICVCVWGRGMCGGVRVRWCVCGRDVCVMGECVVGVRVWFWCVCGRVTGCLCSGEMRGGVKGWLWCV